MAFWWVGKCLLQKSSNPKFELLKASRHLCMWRSILLSMSASLDPIFTNLLFFSDQTFFDLHDQENRSCSLIAYFEIINTHELTTDMEEKVAETLQILEDDGDSFAQRAEMYYKKRPELVSFVEETFRAYRALAERYDHLSRELQSANRTIASVFPDQVQYSVDEDYEGSPRSPAPKPGVPRSQKKDFRSPSMLMSRKGPPKKTASSARPTTTSSSELSMGEALAEIDKLQKEILGLQTEKEFVRSLYERSYDKYWEIEDQITEMQKRVCSLQDEFGVGTVIEDQEARTLMAATALKSCHETLVKLQEVQEKASEEAKAEYQKVKEAHDEFEILRDQFLSKHGSCLDLDDHGDKSESSRSEKKSLDEEMENLEKMTRDVGQLREKIKERLGVDSANSLTVTEMAERIDDLVNKVATLETAVSSQTALVKRLRSETGELQKNIRRLQEDKEILIEDSANMKNKLKELEEELRKVKYLQQNVEHQNSSLQKHFTEASCNLEHLSERLHDVKQDEEAENLVLYKDTKSTYEGKPKKVSEEQNDQLSVDKSAMVKDFKVTNEEKEDDGADLGYDINEENKFKLNENVDLMHEGIQNVLQRDKGDFSETVSNVDIESHEGEGQPNWRQMFINGLDDREKILLEEYTLVLRNYGDVRMRLNEVEKKNKDSIFELSRQVRELMNSLVMKDKEISFLRQKLGCPEVNPDETPLTAMTEYTYTTQEGGKEQEAKSQDSEISTIKKHEENVGENQVVHKRHALSPHEQKLRSDIDDLLEENLDFWLRFSTSVHQIQKFQNSIQDLQAELSAIKDNSRAEGSSKHSIHSEVRPIFRHLREIRTELSLWLEHNVILQDELQGRDSSLNNIQDDISKASNGGSDTGLSEYQAAKFQGEITNMKQENNKVASELQAGLGLVKGLNNEVEKTLAELDQAYGINNHPPLKHSASRMRIPLRSFLFGVKLKRQKQSKQSLFACVNPMQNQYSDIAAPNNAPI
ncbi:protein NETWORKED 2A-like [Neltuma alba]|uniref:protein NETWORKED 2A-like n=1 Tax=Neltuma alba TaxID=207710 RepID=UPI0010A41719|nr:protein NETWORKED 2A-like [Prosopis alba]